MSQSLPTLTPDHTGRPAKKSGWWILLLIAALAVISAALIFFMRGNGSALQSLQAQIEARTLDLRAPMSGTLQSLDVREGQDLEAGQIVLGYDDSRLRLDYLEAQAGYQAALQGLNPGLPAASGWERTMDEIRLEIQRLRQVEDEIQQSIQHWTTIQAQALLALRTPSASFEQQTQAALDEADASGRLAQARQDHENAVRERQQAEASLQTIQNMGRNVSGESLAQLWLARYQMAEQALASASLTAPEAGRVVRLYVRAGNRTVFGDAVLSYVPDGFVQENYWVTAVFAAEDLPWLEIGLRCKVETDSYEFRGRVSSVSIEPDFVKVRIQPEPDADPAKLYAGQLARVFVELP